MSPATVVIGMRAFLKTCRRMTSRSGMPRPRAVSTCSRRSSSFAAARVSRATYATPESASATAGIVMCFSSSPNPDPVPSAGSHPSWRVKIEIRTIAATNEGVDVPTAVAPRITVSVWPLRSAETTPRATPTSRIKKAE